MGRIRIGALLALFVASGAFLGCSQEGTLIIKNDCNTSFMGYADNQLVEIAAGDEVAMDIYIGKKALIVGPNDIEIEVSGSATTKRAFTTSTTVESDGTTIFSITDDVAAILFQNAYSLQINAISVKTCDSDTFGSSYLSKVQVLSPGTTMLIQLEKSCWDIQVNYGREELLDTVTVQVDSLGLIIPIAWIPGYEYEPACARLSR